MDVEGISAHELIPRQAGHESAHGQASQACAKSGQVPQSAHGQTRLNPGHHHPHHPSLPGLRDRFHHDVHGWAMGHIPGLLAQDHMVAVQ